MPIYGFKCYEHDICDDVLCAMRDIPVTGSDDCPKCPECGKGMERYFGSGGVRQTGTGYGSGFVSDALAISPDQIEEHHELFPSIEVLPDGRPRFHNYKQHDNYLEQTGFRKIPQKLKGLGKVRIDK